MALSAGKKWLWLPRNRWVSLPDVPSLRRHRECNHDTFVSPRRSLRSVRGGPVRQPAGAGREVTRLLHVKATPTGPRSRSAAVAEAFVDAFLECHPQAAVDVLDLSATTLPPVGAVAVAAKKNAISGATGSADEAMSWQQTRELVRRFTDADHYLFSVPMWNFGIPYLLKHFIDIVTQPGLTFRLDPRHGYQGLLTGRRACVVYTSGVYTPGCPPEFGVDFQSTYLNYWLRTIGVDPVIEVALRPTDFTRSLAADLDRAREDARKAAHTI
ncbi:NAD(P)H-dependent oxidoreductase [Micromonospora sp. HM134]|nr:NAD(P)H-dependent oxidoreductase [Micromonospora sp. HM134]